MNPGRGGISIIFFCVAFFFYSCNNKERRDPSTSTQPAFYHWKSNFSPNEFEVNTLRRHKIRSLYLHFFDVAWDPTYSKPVPIAQVRMNRNSLEQLKETEFIPTVFITNECIHNIQPEQCRSLAENIHKLVDEILQNHSIDTAREIQIDCDWTAATKNKYFSILRELQAMDSGRIYSATIRLFQVKYMTEAGIPPVKKGLLMCYNMGDLKSMATRNSILDPGTVKSYIGRLQNYPLPLDIALPLFDWYVLFRQGAYKGLVSKIDKAALAGIAKQLAANRFEIIVDTSINNVEFKKGDQLRYENSTYEDIIITAEMLAKKTNNNNARIALYHLDSIILNKYSTHEIEAIFRSFH
jgi:hypothetical protein